jgi:hypothetical protein
VSKLLINSEKDQLTREIIELKKEMKFIKEKYEKLVRSNEETKANAKKSLEENLMYKKVLNIENLKKSPQRKLN